MVLGRINKNKFDLETSYLAKSPCRDCASESNLPGCSDNCRTLSQVQTLLAGTLSRPSMFSKEEEYPLIF